jgi:hypothetical protein
MMIFQKALPRRTFLRGIGTTIALPLLDSMVPAFAATRTSAAAPKLRVGYVYVPVGRIMNKWTPKTTGPGFEFTPTLKPLEPFRKQLLVVSGLNIRAADPKPGEAGGNHARPCASFLTGVHPSPGKRLGISIDQVIAKRLGQETPFASLELGLDPVEYHGGDEGQYSGYYQSTISWSNATTPLPAEDNPRKVFERLFGDADSTDPALRARRIHDQRSVLDSIVRRVARLSRDLGTGDRLKLGEYLEAVRDVERRIQNASNVTDAKDIPTTARPAGVPATFTEHAKLMLDLQVLALQSDMTRVTTLMMGHESTNRTFKEVGATDGHHALSHHKGNLEAIASVEKIDLLQSQMFAYYLNKLSNTPDGDGSLLDHSIIMYGSSLSDGNLHVHTDVPILVAGGATGMIKGDRHLRYEGLPLSNLHLAMLDLAGGEQDAYITPYSDATGKLEGLTA